MTSQTTTRRIGTGTGEGARLLALALGAALAAQVAVIPVAERQAGAAFTERVVFASNRTTGTGVNNPTGDYEIYRMSVLDGKGKRNLTNNGTGVYDGVYPD